MKCIGCRDQPIRCDELGLVAGCILVVQMICMIWVGGKHVVGFLEICMLQATSCCSHARYGCRSSERLSGLVKVSSAMNTALGLAWAFCRPINWGLFISQLQGISLGLAHRSMLCVLFLKHGLSVYPLFSAATCTLSFTCKQQLPCQHIQDLQTWNL